MGLLGKLQGKGGITIFVVNPPQEFDLFGAELSKETTVIRGLAGNAAPALILTFLGSQQELQALVPQVMSHCSQETILWFAYPKLSSRTYRSDLTRDRGWESLGVLGFEPVRQVALDENWSALRFKHVQTIRKLSRKESMALSNEAKTRLQEL